MIGRFTLLAAASLLLPGWLHAQLSFTNSTSGTTGLPKCVMQFENRWFYFHKKAAQLLSLIHI